MHDKLYLFLLCALFSSCRAEGQNNASSSEEQDHLKRLEAKADSAALFCKQQGLNSDFCILVDMKIHSGRNRLFVWDFKKKEVVLSGLCCHGAGGGSTEEMPVFSNTEGSNCTSLGKYKTGARAYSTWGIHVHYKMHGLEQSNDNAFKRIIVLHSYTPVPEKETYPEYLPLGWSRGCPVVSDNIMRDLDALLQESQKPALLWIYYD